MNILMNIIVLIFEVLYYSMFMYYAKKEGKFKRYLLLFSLITIIMMFTGTNSLYSYLIFVLTTLYGLKYIVKIKTSLYDMLIVLIMLLFKLLIEYIIVFIIYFVFGLMIATLFMILSKTIVIFLIKDKLNIIYKKLKVKWDNNNFYIRYIFSCLTYFYIIITVISLINF
mgnify:CR=1 FL=1